MESTELFKLLESTMPEIEYLFFKWNGGGDDWSGFQLIEYKNAEGIQNQKPETLTTEIQNILDEGQLFEEMEFDLRYTDNGWCEGVLLIALKPLTSTFENDSIAYICQDEEFKGFALAGNNHETINANLDFNN